MECFGCGHENRERAKFCEECGTPLLEPAAMGAQLGPPPVTPVHLAEKFRRHRPSEGERRTVTVLFADAVGSTPLAEQLGEEVMYSFMRECLSRMNVAVHRYEGYIASFTGDGVMALFGAPIAHEDSARRAVAAALHMQQSLEEYGREMAQRHGVECHFRVGLNTGSVVVGTVTDNLQMNFTAIGDTVNLAARMEQVADPGSVFISEPTYRTVGDFFDCERLGDLTVKGKAQPVQGWRVLCEKRLRTRFEVATERGLSRFVGRDGELALIDGGPRSASIQTLEPTTALTLTRATLLDLVSRQPQVSEVLLRNLGTLVRRTIAQAGDLVFLDLHGRVAKLLLRLIEDPASHASLPLSLDLGMTQSDLAAMVGGSRQSVNQILHLFERRGYLRLEGHTLIVKDLEALRRRAGSPAPDVLRSRSPREPAD